MNQVVSCEVHAHFCKYKFVVAPARKKHHVTFDSANCLTKLFFPGEIEDWAREVTSRDTLQSSTLHASVVESSQGERCSDSQSSRSTNENFEDMMLITFNVIIVSEYMALY